MGKYRIINIHHLRLIDLEKADQGACGHVAYYDPSDGEEYCPVCDEVIVARLCECESTCKHKWHGPGKDEDLCWCWGQIIICPYHLFDE